MITGFQCYAVIYVMIIQVLATGGLHLHILFYYSFQAKDVRIVHHFHFTEWPDHGVPDKIKLVSFYRKVKRTKATLNGPLTVHCR